MGDLPGDILAARNARMRSVAVGWGLTSTTELSRWSPDLIIFQPDDVLSMLNDLPTAERSIPRNARRALEHE